MQNTSVSDVSRAARVSSFSFIAPQPWLGLLPGLERQHEGLLYIGLFALGSIRTRTFTVI